MIRKVKDMTHLLTTRDKQHTENDKIISVRIIETDIL